MFLEISQNSQEHTCARVSFLIRLQDEAWRDSGKGVFLWILRNFKEQLFYRTPLTTTSGKQCFLRLYQWNIGTKWCKKKLLLLCVKSVRIWSFSGPYFPVFVLNMGWYWVSLCIQSEYVKMRTRKTPNMDTFQAVWDGKIFILIKALKKALMNLCWYQEKELSHLRFRIVYQILLEV